MKRSGFSFAWVVAGACIFAGCSPVVQNGNPPRASKGILDLSQWNFQTDGPVELSGEYEFYWQQLLTPDDFSQSKLPGNKSFINVPAAWNGQQLNGAQLPGFGYATYRLTILLNDNISEKLALKFLDMGTAYAVFANSEKILSVGVVGPTPAESRPQYLPQVVEFAIESNRLELIYQVSNFHHNRGGVWEIVRLGTKAQLDKIREKRLVMDLILFGSILIMGLYHLTLFGLRKNDLSALYFGVYCLLIAIRLLTSVEKYLLQIFPAMNWELLVKIEYLSFYIGVPVFALFLYKLFAQDFHKPVVTAILGLGFLFSGIVIFTPAKIFTLTLVFYQFFMIACMIYGVTMLARFALRKRKDAAIILVGSLFLFATVTNDILDANGFIQTGHFVQLGFFVFIFSHAFVLSSRYAQAFQTIDLQRGELEKANVKYKHEVAERQQMEEALRDNEERFRQLAENIDEVFWLSNVEKDKIFYISPGYEKIWGRSCESLYASPQQWLEAIHPADRDRVTVAAFTKEASGEYDEIYRIQRPDGSIRWIRDRAFPIRDQTGAVYRLAGIAEDITKFKQAEEALRQSEERYRALYEDNPTMYFTVDPAGKVLSVNRFGAEQLGYGAEELIGQPVLNVFYEKDRPQVLQQLAICLENLGEVYDWEFRKTRKDGSVLWVKEHGRAMRDYDGNTVILIVCEDITEQKRTEAAWRESEKFAATGRMAARIAHEINNPLAAIKSSFRLVSRAVPEAHRHYHYLHKIDHEIDRIAEIVQQMLELYRPAHKSTNAFRVDESIEEVMALMRLVGKQRQVRIELEAKGAAAMVRLPERYIRQILYNLLQNAIDASPPGGIIRLTASVEQQRLLIAVSDQGDGVPEEARPHIFEPFYTTKDGSTSGGIGLGLSVCKSLVEAMNGTIDFVSTPGEGTEFRFFVPLGQL